MTRFSKTAPRDQIITFRCTAEQQKQLDAIADQLGLGSRVEVIRTALDYYAEHCPAVKRLVKEK